MILVEPEAKSSDKAHVPGPPCLLVEAQAGAAAGGPVQAAQTVSVLAKETDHSRVMKKLRHGLYDGF